MLIDKVKVAVRIAVNDYDAELQGLIDSAFADLGITDINSDLLTETDIEPLIETAVITYCRMNFGYLSPDQYNKFKASYDEQKAQLSMSSTYSTYEEGDSDA